MVRGKVPALAAAVVLLVAGEGCGGDEAAAPSAVTVTATEPATTAPGVITVPQPAVVTVPRLVGLNVRAAEEALEPTGLRFSYGPDDVVEDRALLGTIVTQSPAPGTPASSPGQEVIVNIAVSTEMAAVPQVIGMTIPRASIALDRAGFSLGRFITAPGDADASVIAVQFPQPGALEPLGRPVDVAFPPATP